RIAAEHVARKLIEHDDERERALRGRLPFGESAGDRGLVGAKEFLADLGVEGLVLGEPLVRPRLAPEGEDVGGADRLRGGTRFHAAITSPQASANRGAESRGHFFQISRSRLQAPPPAKAM